MTKRFITIAIALCLLTPLLSGQSAGVHERIAQAAAQFDAGQAGDNEILSALQDADRQYRCAVLDIASATATNKTFKKVARLYPSLGSEAKADVLNWIANCKAVRQTPLVLSSFGDPDTEVACSAIRTAGIIGGRDAAHALMGEISGAHRIEALAALRSIKVDLTDEVLSALASKPDDNARIILGNLIKDRHITAAAPAMFEFAQSSDTQTALQGLNALSGISAPEDAPRLAALYDAAQTKAASRLAYEALRHSLQSLSPEDAYASVKPLMEASPKPQRYYSLLASTGTDEAVEYLSRAYSAGDKAALRPLSNMEGPAVNARLREVVLAGGDEATMVFDRYIDKVAAMDDAAARLPLLAEVLDDDVRHVNSVLRRLEDIPEPDAFALAAAYLDAPDNAYRAAQAVRRISSKCAEKIDYQALQPALEKAKDIFKAHGSADDGYAVDELNKILSAVRR